MALVRSLSWFAVVAGVACWAGNGSPVQAQQQGATAVQLPTYQFFTVTGSVSVPDRGGTFFGGVDRNASGRNEFGPLPAARLGNRSIGSNASTSNMQVNATIIDLQEMDAAILASAPQRVAGPPLPPFVRSLAIRAEANPSELQFSGAGSGAVGGAPAAGSIAEIRAQKQQVLAERDQAAQRDYDQGQQAEVAGKLGAARIYYRMAAKKATGDLQALAQARLEALTPSSASKNASARGTRQPAE